MFYDLCGASDNQLLAIKVSSNFQYMLQRLYEVGSQTDGIFRKSVNHKKCRELKMKLDSGENVNFHDISVLVVAALLKVRNCLKN